MNPPENTVAVVVDVRNNQGAIQILDKQSNEYVDGVGRGRCRDRRSWKLGHDFLEKALVVLLHGHYPPSIYRDEDLRVSLLVLHITCPRSLAN